MSEEIVKKSTLLLLAIDTCGPTGSVALARLNGEILELLGETELEGRSFTTTLIAGIENLLQKVGATPAALGACVAVCGPGSFTGVRIGLSTAMGLSEGLRKPLATVTRLEVLAAKAGALSAALDAHRSEVFLRICQKGGEAEELLAGAEELAARVVPERIAICDESAAQLLSAEWPNAELVRVAPPTATDALRVALPKVLRAEFADVALLDGHYLRRSDAEIFGSA
ncbi:tRNA (adenosine(37)-N6)-threonylcarbamoyltransferase complex dimerization subunit type 1 TsaB [Telmatobacter bradus]|uniref:tRNA (adenosine(37)-N6)-threonylcarbamoyltransferase complex dimerization subunit type 1 TsaB n=1 Tax=Telmatobacter bradus TaxID=474953 RepID=UPI003B432144